jgi:hypothetical protein
MNLFDKFIGLTTPTVAQISIDANDIILDRTDMNLAGSASSEDIRFISSSAILANELTPSTKLIKAGTTNLLAGSISLRGLGQNMLLNSIKAKFDGSSVGNSVRDIRITNQNNQNSGLLEYSSNIEIENFNLPLEDSENIDMYVNINSYEDDNNSVGSCFKLGINDPDDITSTGVDNNLAITTEGAIYDFDALDVFCVTGSYPEIALASNIETLSSGDHTDVKVMAFDVSNSANPSNFDVILKAMAIETVIVDTGSTGLTVSNYKLYDGAVLMSDCTNLDDGATEINTVENNTTVLCNIEDSSSSAITENSLNLNQINGLITPGNTLNLSIKADIAGSSSGDSVQFKIANFGSADTAISPNDLRAFGNPFAHDNPNRSDFVWLDGIADLSGGGCGGECVAEDYLSAGGDLRSYLDREELSSNLLTITP